MMAHRDEKERFATWVDKRLAKVVRVHAAVRGMTLQDIYEQALAYWVEIHPLTVEDILDSTKVTIEENDDEKS
jgi:hypothetical protein